MTTSRPRRTMLQQVTDLLKALLEKQEAQCVKLHAVWETALTEASKTRQALEMLETGEIKALQSPLLVPPSNTIDVRPPIYDAIISSVEAAENTLVTNAPPSSRPHRQRIGAKAQDVNDVWPAPELGPANHSKLMYARAKGCNLCLEGVPYATQSRKDHYVVTREADDGVGRRFEYQPCTGVPGVPKE